MKQMSEDKRVRLTELEKLTYEVEIGNTRKILKVKGTNLNRAEEHPDRLYPVEAVPSAFQRGFCL